MDFLKTHKKACVAGAAALCICLVFACIYKSVAGAQNQAISSYPNSVNVSAQLETDSTLSVVDQRTFTFDGKNTILNWEIPKTTKLSEVTVSSVRLITVKGNDAEIVILERGNLTEKIQEDLDQSDFDSLQNKNMWFYNSEDNWFYAALQASDAKGEATLEVSFTISNAVYVYDDVAELYWDYLPQAKLRPFEDIFSTSSKNIEISSQILIPTTSEADVANKDTIWGWGHGYEGTVLFVDVGGYVYSSSTTVLNKNSRAHIIFPSSLLTNFDKNTATNVGGARKNNAIKEETEWNDQANVTQGNDAILSIWACAIAGIMILVTSTFYRRITRQYAHVLGDEISQRPKSGTRDQGLGISKNPKEGGTTNPSSLTPNPSTGDGPSLEAQLEFDQRALHFQKVVFIEAILCFLIAVILLLRGGNTLQITPFLLAFVVCLVEANWTPTVHTTFRDRIRA